MNMNWNTSYTLYRLKFQWILDPLGHVHSQLAELIGLDPLLRDRNILLHSLVHCARMRRTCERIIVIETFVRKAEATVGYHASGN